MLELKEMGFEMDFPAIKLKQACGEQVCRVLLFACDHVRAHTLLSLCATPCCRVGARPAVSMLWSGVFVLVFALQALQFQNFHFGRPDYHEEE
jgi:hypothetical protein